MSAESREMIDMPLSARRHAQLERLGYNCAEHTYVTTTVVQIVGHPHTQNLAVSVSSPSTYDKTSAMLVALDSRIDARYNELQVVFVVRTRAQMYICAARLHRINALIVSGILGDDEGTKDVELPANAVAFTSPDDLRNRMHSTPHILFCTIKRGHNWIAHCVRPQPSREGAQLLPIAMPHVSLIVFDEQDTPVNYEIGAHSSSSSVGRGVVSQDARSGRVSAPRPSPHRPMRTDGTTEVVDLMLKLVAMLQLGKTRKIQVIVTRARPLSGDAFVREWSRLLARLSIGRTHSVNFYSLAHNVKGNQDIQMMRQMQRHCLVKHVGDEENRVRALLTIVDACVATHRPMTIFCTHQVQCNLVADTLRSLDLSVACVSSESEKAANIAALESYACGECQLLVMIDVHESSRRYYIDAHEAQVIVNYDTPSPPERYALRAVSAGCRSSRTVCVTLCSNGVEVTLFACIREAYDMKEDNVWVSTPECLPDIIRFWIEEV